MTEQPGQAKPKQHLTIRQAAFIGVGAMVGAGIFALLGAAGEVAGCRGLAVVPHRRRGRRRCRATRSRSSAPGTRRPVGCSSTSPRGSATGTLTGITAWLTYVANAIVTAMVAVSFGSYASSMFAGGGEAWIKVFAALIILVMTAVNIVGSKLVARAQTVIVYRGPRHPRPLRRRHPGQHEPVAARALRVPTVP